MALIGSIPLVKELSLTDLSHAKRIPTRDNDFQHLEVLKRNRKKRQQYGEFFVEGVKCLKAAKEFGWEFVSLCFTSERQLSDWSRSFLEVTQTTNLFDLSAELIDELSDKEEGSELLAVVRMPSDELNRIPVTEESIIVVLDRPASPGNLGTSIRSCDGFGISGVIITGHAADIYHPQAVRGSMGALFSVPVVRLDSPNVLWEWQESLSFSYPNVTSLGTSAKGTQSVYDCYRSKGPLFVFFGNETLGLSAQYKERCEELLSIPIAGHVSSLNVSCALTVTLSHLVRNRG